MIISGTKSINTQDLINYYQTGSVTGSVENILFNADIPYDTVNIKDDEILQKHYRIGIGLETDFSDKTKSRLKKLKKLLNFKKKDKVSEQEVNGFFISFTTDDNNNTISQEKFDKIIDGSFLNKIKMACVNEDKLSKNLPYNPIILKNEEFLQEFTNSGIDAQGNARTKYGIYRTVPKTGLKDDETFVEILTKQMIEAHQVDEAKLAYDNSKLQQKSQRNTDRYGEYKIKVAVPKNEDVTTGNTIQIFTGKRRSGRDIKEEYPIPGTAANATPPGIFEATLNRFTKEEIENQTQKLNIIKRLMGESNFVAEYEYKGPASPYYIGGEERDDYLRISKTLRDNNSKSSVMSAIRKAKTNKVDIRIISQIEDLLRLIELHTKVATDRKGLLNTKMQKSIDTQQDHDRLEAFLEESINDFGVLILYEDDIIEARRILSEAQKELTRKLKRRRELKVELTHLCEKSHLHVDLTSMNSMINELRDDLGFDEETTEEGFRQILEFQTAVQVKKAEQQTAFNDLQQSINNNTASLEQQLQELKEKITLAVSNGIMNDSGSTITNHQLYLDALQKQQKLERDIDTFNTGKQENKQEIIAEMAEVNRAFENPETYKNLDKFKSLISKCRNVYKETAEEYFTTAAEALQRALDKQDLFNRQKYDFRKVSDFVSSYKNDLTYKVKFDLIALNTEITKLEQMRDLPRVLTEQLQLAKQYRDEIDGVKRVMDEAHTTLNDAESQGVISEVEYQRLLDAALQVGVEDAYPHSIIQARSKITQKKNAEKDKKKN